MSFDTYVKLCTEAARLKLEAALLVTGQDERNKFQGLVLWRAAARQEQFAFSSLEVSSPQTRLRSLVEECACYIEARDPFAVQDLWNSVESFGGDKVLPQQEFDAITAKTRPRIGRIADQYRRAWRQVPDLAKAPNFISDDPSLHARLVRQLGSLLDQFPGVPRLWFAGFLQQWHSGDIGVSADCFRRAYGLDPSDTNTVFGLVTPSIFAGKNDRMGELLGHLRREIETTTPDMRAIWSLLQLSSLTGEPDAELRLRGVEKIARSARDEAGDGSLAQIIHTMILKQIRTGEAGIPLDEFNQIIAKGNIQSSWATLSPRDIAAA